VQSSTTLTLAANFENLTLTGNANLNGTGNAAANKMTGNAGANTLNGSTGADTLSGGKGNDTYVTDGGDTLNEVANGGVDTVRASVTHRLGTAFENLTLTGTGNIAGTGNGLANKIIGNAKDNTLNGGLGADTLTGGGGADSFVFSTALGKVDKITDFSVTNDTIHLENAIFTGLSGGALVASAFAANTTGLAGTQTDRVIYETDTGKLFFDSDGLGGSAGVLFATLATGLALTNADFTVI
jgi:Ca2+-binding RTX toxin-like protein